jgi:diguanylate cyclase (GGDEF)-like protein
LLPETPLDQAQVLAERIRASMQKMQFRFSGQEVTITVSLGVSQYESKQPLKDFLQQADEALYEAKRKGRNQVCRSEKEGDSPHRDIGTLSAAIVQKSAITTGSAPNG